MVSLYNEDIISDLEKKIKMSFNDKLLLQRAITHKSFSNENSHLDLRDNERLEFLGDSVLSIVISTFIFDNFPDYPEGELAKMRSVIVSEPILAMQARKIQLGKYLLLGNGEELSGGRERDSILADTMEALIGAIYLDLGIDMARKFIISNFNKIIIDVEKGKYIQDYKTILQELLQKDGFGRPIYQVVDEKGPDHNKSFVIDVLYQDKKIGSGKGSSKKEAEQNAAMAALKNMNII
ncbi:ribonuclease III [Halocella sp. SP3-1]|uniref:ribonuclease III n=1 Tax=Halocella sp. SP3-1 TaxID=2382161 RepID=UPI000F756E41|nr:ribonuclease III [Halocella sp. SP3-1]AZO95341.1 ribonuclease III [Halocella sp. SP3-1]